MMYINIKKLYSWRIRPYKIPSFFFSLLFPFFSLFFFPPSSPFFPFFSPLLFSFSLFALFSSAPLLPPFFLSSPLMVCECAPALAQVNGSSHTFHSHLSKD